MIRTGHHPICPKGRAIDVVVAICASRLGKLRMIQNVEVLHPELEIDAFRDGCCLGECQIKVSLVRSAQVVPWCTIGALRGIVYGIEEREAGIDATRATVIRKADVGKTIGIKVKVAGDRSRRDQTIPTGVATVVDDVDGRLLPRIQVPDRSNQSGVGKKWVSGA